MYDLETKEFFVSRDVVFVEHEFPYMKDVICDEETRNMTGSNDVFVDDVEYRHMQVSNMLGRKIA